MQITHRNTDIRQYLPSQKFEPLESVDTKDFKLLFEERMVCPRVLLPR